MRVLFAAVVCTLVSTAGQAKDRSDEWKFLAIFQPQMDFLPNRKPDFKFRRIRGIATGPITDRLKAKVQVNLDDATPQLQLLDAYLDYTRRFGDWRISAKGGQLYPNWGLEGQTFANTVNFAYVTAAPRMFQREAGASVGLAYDRYELSAGVFDGVQSFNDTNAIINGIVSFTTVQPWFDARAWYYAGKDGNLGAESTTEIIGAEVTGVHLGRLVGNASYSNGRRYGRRFWGTYVEAAYNFTPETSLWLKFDTADLNGAVPGSTRQRYIASVHQRIGTSLNTKWDLEFEQSSGQFSALMQGDLRF